MDVAPVGPKHAPPVEVEEFDHVLFAVDCHDMQGFKETADHGKGGVHHGQPQGQDGYQDRKGRGPFQAALERKEGQVEPEEIGARVPEKDRGRMKIISEKTQDAPGENERNQGDSDILADQ